MELQELASTGVGKTHSLLSDNWGFGSETFIDPTDANYSEPANCSPACLPACPTDGPIRKVGCGSFFLSGNEHPLTVFSEQILVIRFARNITDRKSQIGSRSKEHT